MKFSVVIPVYNAADYLEETVGSVQRQTYQDFEIFLVDDGSTDGRSGGLCNRLSEEMPEKIYVLHKENGGAGDARNAALSQVSGDYIIFLDSDDTLEPEAFSRLSEEIQRTQGDIYYFGMRMTDGTKTIAVFQEDFPSDRSLSVADTPRLLLINPSACIAAWKRTLFLEHEIRFRARGWGEDLCMTRKMLTKASSVRFVPDILYNYLQHQGSVTRRENLSSNGEILEALEDVLVWFQQQGIFATFQAELCKLCVDNVLYDASVRILQQVPSHGLLQRFYAFTTQWFPDYRENPYVRDYPKKKKLILWLLGKKQYRAVHLLFRAVNGGL